MAKKLYEEASVQAIANAIRGKNGLSSTYKIADMAQAITDIPTGSSDTTFWAGGKNAELIGTYSYTLNLANDTSFSSTTPSTSSKTIFAASQTAYRKTQTGNNLNNHNYICILDVVIPHAYTSLPSVVNTDIVVLKSSYHIGRRINSTATTPNYNVALVTGSAGVNRYRNAANTTTYTGATAAYGVGATTVAPTFASTSSATTNIYLPNPAIAIRTSSTYMASGAWANLDATNTNINIRWQVFRIDKPSISSELYDFGYDEVIARDFTTNEVNI